MSLSIYDGTLRVRGLQHLHADPAAPCEYVEEPFCHLDLPTSSEQDRREKVIRYEVARPHLGAEGGGRLRWPARLDQSAEIRLSYRWLSHEGSVHTPEGPRSAFPRVVNPGDAILAPLHVDAPPDVGDYVLEVDIVHEHVRWFGCPCHVPVRVEYPRGLPPTGPRLRETPQLSNLVRYELPHRFGGVYVDTDVECLRPLTPLLRGIDAFAALELQGRVGRAVLGSVAGHQAFARAARLARQTLGVGATSADANGPYFLSLILEQEPDLAIFGPQLFYPYLWDELERHNEPFPDAYAIHHWASARGRAKPMICG